MMQKLYKKLFIALALTTCVSSCNFLDEDTTGQPTPDKFFGTLTDFQGFISGAYTPIIQLYGTDAPYVAGSAAEDVNAYGVVRWRPIQEGNWNNAINPEEITDVLWDNSFVSISACNTTIDLIRNNEKVSAEELIPIHGEACFLRAFNYFNLVRWFGEIPLLKEDNQSNATYEPQSSVIDIYESIVSDLKLAEEYLPATQNDKSKPTYYAAKSLLAKVYLTMAGFPLNQTDKYALARDKAKEVMDSGMYSLESNFFNLWLWQNRMTNSEFIFTLYASSNNGTGGYINRAVRPREEKGWADWTSDKTFLASFPVGDNSRVKGTFYLTLNAEAGNITWEQSQLGEPYCSKLRDGGDKAGNYYGSSVANLADGFYSMIRYADVLLIYAEAANMAENGPSQTAYSALTQVRSRAGLSTTPGMSQIAFDEAVLEERNWELAFECNRWFDICRRKMVEQVVRKTYPSAVIDDHNYIFPKPKGQLTVMLGVKQNPGY